jgi:hypothetical protein
MVPGAGVEPARYFYRGILSYTVKVFQAHKNKRFTP